MTSKLSQKLFAVCLIVFICFVAACGKNAVTSDAAESSEGMVNGPSTCYAGVNKTVCAELKTIDAAKEGYNNPYTDSSFMANANKDQYRRPILGVNLEKASPNLKVAPDFILGEFMSLHKGSYGIFSSAVVKIVQKLRDKIGAALKINSAFRSPKWNEGVDGSAKWSRHQYGDGVDIVSNKASLDTLVKLCKSLGATYVDKYVAHVHCDWRNLPLEPTFFGSVKTLETKNVEEQRESIYKDLNDSSQIHISGTLKVGNIILLTSSIGYKEDAEELYKKWIIIKPNGDQIQLEQAEVSLPLQKGTYQVIHYIGENVQINKSFFVN